MEEAPERQSKRQAYWSAVDALKKVAKEGDDFILEPATFTIYDSKDVVVLGKASEGSFEWEDDRIKMTMPDVDLPSLRKAAIRRPNCQ